MVRTEHIFKNNLALFDFCAGYKVAGGYLVFEPVGKSAPFRANIGVVSHVYGRKVKKIIGFLEGDHSACVDMWTRYSVEILRRASLIEEEIQEFNQ